MLNPTNSYGKTKVSEIIDYAFFYHGGNSNEIDTKAIKFGIRALNRIFTMWINENIIQFYQLNSLIKLENNIISYKLPSNIRDVFDLNLSTYGRQSTGIPYSTAGGNASACFDNILTNSCIQTSPNGAIGIDFSVEINNPRIINYVGILTVGTPDYQLIFEGSNDNGINWTPVHIMERPLKFMGGVTSQSINWFQIQAPQSFKKFQIRETNNETLAIHQIYFMSYINSIYRDGIGRSEYMQLSSRNSQSFMNTYTIKKNASGLILDFFGAPEQIPSDQSYNSNLNFYNYIEFRGMEIEDSLNYLSSTISINPLFLPALEAFLIAEFANYFQKDSTQFDLKAEKLLFKAKANDSDNGGLNFTISRT